MAKNATEYLVFLREAAFSCMHSSAFFLKRFDRKTELLSYLILCVAKMPFIPPVSIVRPRSISGLSGLTSKDRTGNGGGLPAAALAKTKVPAEDKGSSVKERLATLRQLGKKSQPRSRLPTGKSLAGSGAGLYGKGRDHWLPSSRTLPDRFPASSSGESMPPKQQRKQGSADSSPGKSEPESAQRTRHQEEACFTLTLTPEVVLLLQRRSHERQQRLASRSAGGSGGGAATGGSLESRRRRENYSKRHQLAVRHGAPSSRAAAKNVSGDAVPGDVSSLVKVSLLNERYKYDDVEYEEEDDGEVDERVVLKCTEWLRGLENAPVTVGGMDKGVTYLKSF